MKLAPKSGKTGAASSPIKFLSGLRARHFELLVALDDLHNVGKAAEATNVSQPAVSKALAELETGLGVRLFDRSPKGLFPTSYGQCLIKHARSVLATLTRARDELHELRSGEGERLTVGTNPHAAVGVIPQALVLLKQRRPKTTVAVREGHTDAHLMDLWLGRLDVYVGRIPHDCPQGLEIRTFSKEPMKLVTGSHHPLTTRTRIQWRDLCEYPWVLPPIGTPQREPLDRTFEAHGLPMPENRIETLSVHTLQAYLNSTDAIAAVAPQVARYYEELGFMKILPLAFPSVARASGIAWNKQRAMPAALEAFMDCVEASYLAPAAPQHNRKAARPASRRAPAS